MNEFHADLLERAAAKAVDVLLVSFNSAHLLPRLRSTLLHAAQGGLTLRLLAVDNASSDGSAAILSRCFACDVMIENSVNVGFGRANNQLLAHVRSEYVLLLNTDAFVGPETIATTVAYMDAHPRCGIVGVRLTDAEGGLQPSRRSFPTPFTTFLRRTGLERLLPVAGARHDIEEDHSHVAECDWVPGCYYLVRRAVLDDIGLFDPRFFLYFEEVDHCRRAREAGWTVTYLPSTSVVHVGGESAKSVTLLSRHRQISALQAESELLYMRKHFGLAGLASHLLLVVLGDFILACKDLLKSEGTQAALGRFRCTSLTWRLARATALGMRPTR
jgi:N-acetylglucosaminyl-diphospho-decaprenol L-rhamnosyltransferase